MPEWAVEVGRRMRFFYELPYAARYYNLGNKSRLWHLNKAGAWELIAWQYNKLL
jgi:hypothetical protein